MSSKEFRHIVRVKNTDIDGTKQLAVGLSKIRGLGISMSNAIVKAADLRSDMRIGQLTSGEVTTIEDIISDPAKHGIPSWMTNHRRDIDSGRDLHLVGADLSLKIKTDIDFMKDIRSWKGIRHSLGLKVRGQRTKTTGRKGKAVGVQKKVAIAAMRAAAQAKTE